MFRNIPTLYKNIWFRSRLEAETAYLLDALSLAWEYEQYNFLLHSGIHYMPDFYVPGIGLWIECRGYLNDQGQKQIEQFGEWIQTGHLGRGLVFRKVPTYQQWSDFCDQVDEIREQYCNTCSHELYSPACEVCKVNPKNPQPDLNWDEVCDFLVIGPDRVALYEYAHSTFGQWGKDEARLAFCKKCRTWSFIPSAGNWHCRNCGAWDKHYQFSAWYELDFVGHMRIQRQSIRQFVSEVIGYARL